MKIAMAVLYLLFFVVFCAFIFENNVTGHGIIKPDAEHNIAYSTRGATIYLSRFENQVITVGHICFFAFGVGVFGIWGIQTLRKKR